MSSESNYEPRPFQLLGQFSAPSRPTDETIRQTFGKFWQSLRRESEDPFLTDNALRVANTKKLDRIVPPPACGPLLSDMRATFDQWAQEPDPNHALQLVVLPPCDHSNVVGSWAKQAGYAIVDPPPRLQRLGASGAVNLPDLSSIPGNVLVIPRLEYWFLRRRNGLDVLRRLLEKLALLDRHCVIGCNSWAWSFFEKTLGADLIFPHGVTLQAFDALRLHQWFSEIVQNGEAEGKVFRLCKNGQDILALNGGSDKLKSDFLATLAAKSLGIPWVAWHMWRSSLRYGPKDNARIANKFPNEETLWVTHEDDFQIPKTHASLALLTLHAILLHHALTAEEMMQVLPTARESNVLYSLLSTNLVQLDGEQYSCVPAAYPSIRQALANAGFPLDRL